MNSIAILGATSHVAKNIIAESIDLYDKMYLYARRPNRVDAFINEIGLPNDKFEVKDFSTFGNEELGVSSIINCIGFGTPQKVKNAGFEIYKLAETIDNNIIDFIQRNRTDASYINFSSGAVYGTEHIDSCSENHLTELPINKIEDKHVYMISKLYSEAKHRSLNTLDIIDIRLFSFFSSYIDLSSGFLLTELLNCIANDEPFITTKNDIYRDFVSPNDLAKFVYLCTQKRGYNGVLDIFSQKETSKLEIISMLKAHFGLKVQFETDLTNVSPTGNKSMYYTKYCEAEKILKYKPSQTSIESIKTVFKTILKSNDELI